MITVQLKSGERFTATNDKAGYYRFIGAIVTEIAEIKPEKPIKKTVTKNNVKPKKTKK
jgi:hypothetical protein